jgi:AcrR family transcriptional regulator
MPYRHTEKVARKLAARHVAILTAACELAAAGGVAAVQIALVAERAGVAAGTIYRYFPSKTELVAALVAARLEEEVAAIASAVKAAPGPLSALAAAIMTIAARAIAQRRLAFALIAEPVDASLDAARVGYRQRLAVELEALIRKALAGGHLPDQDAPLAAAAVVGALSEALIGPLARSEPADAAKQRAQVQMLCLFALRALGVADARARGLVVHAVPFPPPLAGEPVGRISAEGA